MPPMEEAAGGAWREGAGGRCTVLVVGAGVSGLCTAALLCRAGVRNVTVLERSLRVGGRTASSRYRGHILDNGFHIMPFYRASALYRILEATGTAGMLELARVTDIAFATGRGRFARYPRGIADLLRLETMPLRSRIRLLRAILPMAFSTMGAAARLDRAPLSDVVGRLDAGARPFFEAVCMLAFADVPERVSLGEFTRTMIRANPFRGGTSEFAYPAQGGYDRICGVLARYVRASGGRILTGRAARRVVVEGGRAVGAEVAGGGTIESDCTVVSLPAYEAARRLFGPGDLDGRFARRVSSLDRTTAVVETHFCTSKRVDKRQVVFPVGAGRTARGVFFVSNISPAVSPEGEHLLMAGTPVSASDARSASRTREISDRMRRDISELYPAFEKSVVWERPSAWPLVESVAKEPGAVWRDKVPHAGSGVDGLFFVGDSTVSYGIGTDSAAHSSQLCHPLIVKFLNRG